MDQKWDQRRKEKEQRKEQQRANVERKRLLKVNTRANSNGDRALSFESLSGLLQLHFQIVKPMLFSPSCIITLRDIGFRHTTHAAPARVL